jgi:hypothetical protein
MLESPRERGDLGEAGPGIAGQLADRELDLVEDRDRGVAQQRAELREGPVSFRACHDCATALDERQTQPKLPQLELRLGEQEMRGGSLLRNQLPGLARLEGSMGNRREPLRILQGYPRDGELTMEPEADPRSQGRGDLRKTR